MYKKIYEDNTNPSRKRLKTAWGICERCEKLIFYNDDKWCWEHAGEQPEHTTKPKW